MKKVKWLFFLCLMVMFVCGNAYTVNAENEYNGMKYIINDDNTITITDYKGKAETVIIPSEIDGISVKSIGGEAFNNCDTIKHVTISEGITSIDSNRYFGAFAGCNNLESVSLPSTLKIIGDNAFMPCHGLTHINLPDGLISIGDDSFGSCYILGNIDLPNSLTSIKVLK